MSTNEGAAHGAHGGLRPAGRPTVDPPTRHPVQQPLRPAIALAIIMALLLLGQAVGTVSSLIVPDGIDIPVASARTVVLALVVSVVVLAGAGLALAGLVLSILVAVQGRGALRLGAVLLLASTLCGMLLSFEVTGDPSNMPAPMAAAAGVIAALEIALAVVRFVLDVAGLVLLVLGTREVRAARRSRV